MPKRPSGPSVQAPHDMMTTHEVADYLRVKERKIYELVRDKLIPCSRVTGKWLFPRRLIDRWVAENADYAGVARPAPPPVIAGSHDPLLDWAARESGCGLALLPGGSLDGLRRLARGEATLCGLHLRDGAGDGYNTEAARDMLAGADVVLVEWAWRRQGLVLAPGNRLKIAGIADLKKKKARVVRRQAEAGSQVLLLRLLEEAGIAPGDIAFADPPAMSETELGMAVLEGRADAGLAVEAAARQLKLDFVPLARERYDLAMRRRDYFEAPVQRLLAFARDKRFAAQAARLGGYEVGGAGTVRYNAP
ncbi:MAG: substrate-binding domain-containing protein [Rhodospirillales bacterium]